MNPLVSVIIPTYNRSEYLVECLSSVLGQSYRPLEVLVVDDGSTDGTAKTVHDKFGSDVAYIPLLHSGLPALARNAGIDAAKGDYAAFCDSDDIWVSDKLEIQVRRLMNLHCTLSCSDAFIIGSEGKRYLEHYRFRPWGLNNDLLWENFIITSSVVIRRTTLGERRFTTDPVFRGYEDYLLWLALRETLAIDFVNEPLCGYRKHAASISAENRHRDARQQLRIMASQAAFLHHPLIALRKTARYIYHALR